MGTTNAKQQNLQIKIISGETQSQQLFDFHSSQRQVNTSELKFPSMIVYKEGDIVYQQENPDLESSSLNCEPLYRLSSAQHHKIKIQQLFKRDNGFDDHLIWKVLGEGEQIPLEEGDWIKIGKVKMRFKEIVGSNSPNRSTVINSDRDETERMDLTSPHIESVKTHPEGQCRICFENSDTIENPMLSLCKCSGSVKYIHFECLKDWIANNIRKQTSPPLFSHYSFFEPKCDLCKEPIENEFKHEGLKYTLYQFDKIEPPYAVFENKVFDQQANKIKISLYMINLPERTEISVGRNHNSLVNLRDISVSRNHCTFIYKMGKIFLQDRKSKFGTLVCPRRGFEFNSTVGLQLQFQSRVIEIGQETKFNNCCCAESSCYQVEFTRGSD